MINLDVYVNNSRARPKRKPMKCIPQLLMLIRTNTFDSSNWTHAKWKKIGIKYGYIDDDLNILKGG